MQSVIQPNRQTYYFAGLDAINQLQETSAVADFIQTTHAIARWATSDVGPDSDHNLILNSDVILTDGGDIENINSLELRDLGAPTLSGISQSGGALFFNGAPVGGGGGGDVVGPFPSIDNAIVRYDGITGKVIQTSSITIDDVDNIENANNISVRPGASIYNDIYRGNTLSGPLQLLTSGSSDILLNPITNNVLVYGNGVPFAGIVKANNIEGDGGDNVYIRSIDDTDIHLDPPAGHFVIINPSCLGLIDQPAYANPTPATGTKSMRIDNIGIISSQFDPVYICKSVNGPFPSGINQVTNLYYPVMGDSLANYNTAHEAGQFLPVATNDVIRLESMKVWLTTGGTFTSGGAGMTFQLYMDGVAFGNPINITALAASSTIVVEQLNTLPIYDTSQRLSLRINQTVITANVIAYGLTLTFRKT